MDPPVGEVSRRAFLGSSLLSLLGASCALRDEGRADGEAEKPLLDIHVHLFGTGDGGSGCRLSRRITEGVLFKTLAGLLGVKERAATFDEGYESALLEQVRGSGLDRVVLLAQDGVYDATGKLDEERTHVYVPNEYLFEVVGQHRERLIPCPSINPDRADCIEELERCHDAGARILKVHPPIQGVDVSDPEHRRFFSRCAELEVIVMVHTGHEHSAPVIDKHLSDPLRLRLALEEGCTVVACHAGTGWPEDEPDFLPRFLEMTRRYERLWGDTAVLGTARRVRDVERLLAEEGILSRLLHGSDFPFPSSPVSFAGTLGLERALGLQAEANLLKRDLDLKEALGFGRESARRAHGFVVSRGRGGPREGG